MRRAVFAVPVAALVFGTLHLDVADSTVVLGNNVLHSISVLTPLRPTNPAQVIGMGWSTRRYSLGPAPAHALPR